MEDLSGVSARIEAAPHEYNDVLHRFVKRCEGLGCAVVVPDAEKEDYLNVYPPGSTRGRVASFRVRESTEMRGPRAEIYCSPEHAASHPPAEQAFYNGTPRMVKVYLGDTGSLEAALALVTIAIQERHP